MNTTTDALYDAINESEVTSAGIQAVKTNQGSGPKNQDTIYEAVDEMESSQRDGDHQDQDISTGNNPSYSTTVQAQHDSDHQDQDISTGNNPSYSTTVQAFNVQPQESENAIQESHPNDQPLQDLTLGANPSYSSVSIQATVPQDYEVPPVTKRDITESVFEISDNIIDETQPHQDISLRNNPSYSTTPATMTQSERSAPNTPEIYEVLDEQEFLGTSSNEPQDISVENNPSYERFKNADKGPAYHQDASTIDTSTQEDVSTVTSRHSTSAALGQQAMSPHSSDSRLKLEASYEEILKDDENDDYI